MRSTNAIQSHAVLLHKSSSLTRASVWQLLSLPKPSNHTNMSRSPLLTFLSATPLSSTRPCKSSRPSLSPLRTICTASASTTSTLSSLREKLRANNLSAFLIPTSDPHNSEYPPPHYARRSFVSGFTGSAGTALVTLDAAYLWTDGRYFLQADTQLGPEWTLMKAGLKETPSVAEFLEKLEGNVGIDPFVHCVNEVDDLKCAFKDSDRGVVCVEPNPVDAIWKERPSLGADVIRIHDERWAGKSVVEKLHWLRKEMIQKDVQSCVFSMLDEVCWLFNIRGKDIPHCPVVIAYAVVSLDDARLYVDPAKVPSDVTDKLESAGVTVVEYSHVLQDIRATEGKVWLDPRSTSVALSDAAGDDALKEETPVMLAKAVKNGAELDGMRQAHLRDGVALSKFLCWLEDFVTGGGLLNEVQAAEKLEQFRAMEHGFLMTSFSTIAGSGPNGAVIHYSAEEETCAMVNGNQVFLLDSGGQYVDGTTDVTRTMQLGGTATPHEKECYTRVLQGHIAIDQAVFPEDTTGLMLDALARVPLWRIGLDYRHGTGHGVGAGLNVHEGPQSISPRVGSNKTGLKEGMIVSNEPGYYEDGKFGIRIENLLVVVKKETAHGFGGKSYLGFERLTHVPIDMNMINPDVLSEAEIEWLDSYHGDVWAKLSPLMEEGRYKEWLREKTMPIRQASLKSNQVTTKSAGRL